MTVIDTSTNTLKTYANPFGTFRQTFSEVV